MHRDVLGWLGALLGVSILAPVLLYLFTGAAVGFLVSCGGSDAMVVAASGTETLELSCPAVRTLVKAAVAVGGSGAATVGLAIVAVGDLQRNGHR